MAGETLLSDVEMTVRLLLAAAMGAVIEFERERLIWAAGLRTHMLVCLGSCLFMLVSAFGFSEMLGRKGDVILDPSRVASQVVTGIGFIGAGTLLLRGEVIKGLTTAASLWVVAAIGLAIDGGLYIAAGATTLMTLVILAGLKLLEDVWHNHEAIGDLVVAAEGARSRSTPCATWRACAPRACGSSSSAQAGPVARRRSRLPFRGWPPRTSTRSLSTCA